MAKMEVAKQKGTLIYQNILSNKALNPLLIPTCISDCIKNNPISHYKRLDPNNCKFAISQILDYGVSLFEGDFSLPIKMNLVNFIINNFWHLTLEEVAMVYNRAAIGMYDKNIPEIECDGRVYGKVMPKHFTVWLRMYDCDDRLTYFEDQNLKYKEPYEKQLEETTKRDIQAISDLTLKKKKEYKAIQKAQNEVFGPTEQKHKTKKS